MSEDNHVSIMAIMSRSSSDIRISSCVNLFLRHFALKEYISSGKVSFPFLRIMLCKYLQVSSFLKLIFGLLGLVWFGGIITIRPALVLILLFGFLV